MKKHPLFILFCVSLAALVGVAWCGMGLRANPHDTSLLAIDAVFVFVCAATGLLWLLGVAVWIVKRVWLSTLTSAVQARAGFQPPTITPPPTQAKAERGKGEFTGGRSFIPK